MFSRIREMSEERVESLFARLWVRRTLGVGWALGMAAWPVAALWRLGLAQDFSFESVLLVAWSGLAFVLTLMVLGPSLPEVGYRPAAALLALLPVVGAAFLVVWLWRLSLAARSKRQRMAFREIVMARLDNDLDRQVYRFRYDVDEDRFYSRRKTARILGISADDVAQAEARIDAAVEAVEASERKALRAGLS